MLALLGLLATVNPAAAAAALDPDRRTGRPAVIAAGAVAAGGLLLVLGAAADPLLRGLDVSAGTFRLGAGAVAAATGVRWLVAGPPTVSDEPSGALALAAFVTFPVLFTPGAAALVVAFGIERGTLGLVAPVVVAVLAGALGVHGRRRIPPAVVDGAVRLLGSVAVVVGVLVTVDGVQHL